MKPIIQVIGRELSLALVDYLMTMYHRNHSQTRNLVDNTDLHILHSMNPDGFEKADQVCNGSTGRTNANGVILIANFTKLFIIVFVFQVDLNRDFPTYFDLKHTKKYKDLYKDRAPETKVRRPIIDGKEKQISDQKRNRKLIANYIYTAGYFLQHKLFRLFGSEIDTKTDSKFLSRSSCSKIIWTKKELGLALFHQELVH